MSHPANDIWYEHQIENNKLENIEETTGRKIIDLGNGMWRFESAQDRMTQMLEEDYPQKERPLNDFRPDADDYLK